jgi:uncharacterized protein YcbK (DUF882 family)
MTSGARALLLAIVAALVPAAAYGDGPPKPTPKAAAHPPTAKRAEPPASRPVIASRGWHALPAGASPSLDTSGRPMLTLQGLNIPDRVSLTAASDRGGFSAEDLDRAAHVLRDPRTGNEHPVDPHVLDVVYRLAVHFSAPEVRIISGYRTPRPGNHSNHAKGRAIDLVIPGATDEDVAKFAREQGFCGVGIYPTSGFVHVDVREHSYFWVDNSGPGKRNRTHGILGDLALKSDSRAVARGEHGAAPSTISFDVDAALAETHAGAGANGGETDDDDGDDASP